MQHKHKKSLEEIGKQPSHDRYLITYADLLTLLFALFIILYSISKPDKEKTNEMFQAINNIFNPNQVIEGNNKSPNINSEEMPPAILFPSKPITVDEIYDKLAIDLDKLIKNKKINFERTTNGIKIIIPDKFLFQSGSSALIFGNTILDTIALTLKEIDMQIQIDGHTDNKSIRNSTFESNWHLSGARAASVLKTLVSGGVPPHNLIIRAFGEQRPVSNNETESGRATNRRVEIIIAPKEEANAATGT